MQHSIRKKRRDYDREAKLIMSYQDNLAFLIKNTLPSFRTIPIRKIEEHIIRFGNQNQNSRFVASLDVEDKKTEHAEIRYDLKFGLHHPTDKEHPGFIINIEMQHSDRVGYQLKNRAKYYVSRLISGQKNDSEGFLKDEYDEIKQVVSIWICMYHKKEKDNTIERYVIRNRNYRLTTNELLSEKDDDEEIIIIYPEQDPEDVVSEINLSNFLNILFRPHVMTKEEKFKILEEKYGILLAEEFKAEVKEMGNLSQGVWEDGMKAGRKEGILFGTVQHVKSLMEELPGMDADKAMDILKVDESLRDKVIEALNK